MNAFRSSLFRAGLWSFALLLTLDVKAQSKPEVYIFSPTNGAVYRTGPTNLTLYARAIETNGAVATVQFFAGSDSLGVVSNSAVFTNISTEPLFPLAWPNVAAGLYPLSAVATGTNGLTTTSAVVSITVTNTPTPSVPFSIGFYYPTNGESFLAPATIYVHAYVTDSNVVKTVQYFSGTTSIGIVSNLENEILTNTSTGNPFFMNWSNVSAGSYTLTAAASDSAGQSITSAPITINVTNKPTPVTTPSVYIYSPTNDAVYTAPTNLTLYARASESNGSIATVQFFAGSNILGVVSNSSLFTNVSTEPLFSLVWSNVTAGAYALEAVATDLQGRSATSSVVSITVKSPPAPVPFVVGFFYPTNGQSYLAPASVRLYANVSDSNLVRTMRYFAGTTSIGIVSNIDNVVLTSTGDISPFNLNWTNVPAGNYAVTAVATDKLGLTATSPVVNINVTNPTPPNIPFAIGFFYPTNGQTFVGPATIGLHARVADSNIVESIQYFAGTTKVGTVSNSESLMVTNTNSTNPFFLAWSNVPTGNYTITAVANDSAGHSVTSAPVSIYVVSTTGTSATITFTDSWFDNTAILGPVPTSRKSDLTLESSSGGSYKLQATLPMAGVDVTKFGSNTLFSLLLGPTFGVTNQLADDPAYRPGKTNATFQQVDPGTGSNLITFVSWTSRSLIIAETEPANALGASQGLGDAGPARELTVIGSINTTFDFNVGLGAFLYNNSTVPVTGSFASAPWGNSGSISSGTAHFSVPSIYVSTPTNDLRTTSSLISCAGSASDTLGLQGVWAILNGDTNDAFEVAGPFDIGSLKATNWSTTIDLLNPPAGNNTAFGTNVIQFYAVDWLGDQSSAVSRAVVWLQTNTLALNIDGSGSVKGLTNGEGLIVGQTYPVNAYPSNGWSFLCWSNGQGSVLSTNSYFHFTNYGKGVLNAVFTPNPYLVLRGAYAGLFIDTNTGVAPTNAGCINLIVTTEGAYSGSLYLGTSPTPYHLIGQFLFPPGYVAGGQVVAEEFLAPSRLDIQLQLNTDTDLSDANAGSVTGTVTQYADENRSNALWTATVMLEMAISASNTAQPGLYNLEIPPVGTNAGAAPGGFSYATATLSSAGAVNLTLNLADGVSPTLSSSSALVLGGRVPFFNSLYSGKGVILGWLVFTNDTGIDGGGVSWVREPVSRGLYASGFNAYFPPGPMIGGSLYLAPKSGTNIVSGTLVNVNLSGGNLANSLQAQLMYNPAKNTFALENTNEQPKVSLILTESTGALSGYFTPGQGQSAIPFKGVLLPESIAGYGFFTGTNQTGGFSLETVQAVFTPFQNSGE